MKNFTSLQYSIIVGLLLSDGTLVKRKKGLKAGAYFSLTKTINLKNINVEAHVELVLYVFELFKDLTNFSEPHLNWIKLNNKRYQYIYFNTIIDPLFTELHNNWYIDGEKTVPSNISQLIDPIVLAGGLWVTEVNAVKVFI